MAKNEAAAEAVRSLPNPHLSTLNGDFLYHIGFSRHEIRDIFHDIKVCRLCNQDIPAGIVRTTLI